MLEIEHGSVVHLQVLNISDIYCGFPKPRDGCPWAFLGSQCLLQLGVSLWTNLGDGSIAPRTPTVPGYTATLADFELDTTVIISSATTVHRRPKTPISKSFNDPDGSLNKTPSTFLLPGKISLEMHFAKSSWNSVHKCFA